MTSMQKEEVAGPSSSSCCKIPPPPSSTGERETTTNLLRDEFDDLYDDWNPMEFVVSKMENYGETVDDLEGLITGESASNEVPCAFHDGFSGSCWKGSRCIYSHRTFTGGKFLQDHENFKVGVRNDTRAITHAVCLLDKPLAPKYSTFPVRVVCVKSPFEFYVMPHNKWACVCKKAGDGHLLDDEDINDDSTSIGEKIFKEMQKGLALIMKRNKAAFQSPTYCIHQLVAVRIHDEKSDNWHRGIVEDDFVPEFEEINPHVKIQLLDLPYKISASPKDVASLPVQYSRINSMIFKCALSGCSPVGRIWTKSASNYFRNMVLEKLCLMEIQKTILPDYSYGHAEKDPYFVRLTVLDKCKNFDPVKKLIDRSKALAWNPFPLRPSLVRKVPYHYFKFLEKEENKIILLTHYLPKFEADRLLKAFQRFNLLPVISSVVDAETKNKNEPTEQKKQFKMNPRK